MYAPLSCHYGYGGRRYGYGGRCYGYGGRRYGYGSPLASDLFQPIRAQQNVNKDCHMHGASLNDSEGVFLVYERFVCLFVCLFV